MTKQDPRTAEQYVESAKEQIRLDNKIAAVTLLEEGYARFLDPQVLDLLKRTRQQLEHLRSRESYLDFYERQQQKPKKYHRLGRRLRRAIWGLLGVRTRRVVAGCERNPRYQHLENDIRSGGFKKILDIGSWEGHFATTLGARNTEIEVTGVEIATTNIEIANELNRYDNVRFVQGFAEDVKDMFPPGHFDFIMLFEILEHVIDVELVVTSALTVLRSGGKIAITVPAEPDEHDHGGGHDEHVRFIDQRVLWQTTKVFYRARPSSTETGKVAGVLQLYYLHQRRLIARQCCAGRELPTRLAGSNNRRRQELAKQSNIHSWDLYCVNGLALLSTACSPSLPRRRERTKMLEAIRTRYSKRSGNPYADDVNKRTPTFSSSFFLDRPLTYP